MELDAGERHAAHRCQERYGVPLTDGLKHTIVREIRRAMRAFKAQRRSKYPSDPGMLPAIQRAGRMGADGRNRWTVDVDGAQYHVIYDATDRIIVTFLPPYAEYGPK
jgi:hypothetical protein